MKNGFLPQREDGEARRLVLHWQPTVKYVLAVAVQRYAAR
jgi:hypothetical protein